METKMNTYGAKVAEAGANWPNGERIVNVRATTEAMAKAKIRRFVKGPGTITEFWQVGQYWDELGRKIA